MLCLLGGQTAGQSILPELHLYDIRRGFVPMAVFKLDRDSQKRDEQMKFFAMSSEGNSILVLTDRANLHQFIFPSNAELYSRVRVYLALFHPPLLGIFLFKKSEEFQSLTGNSLGFFEILGSQACFP